MIRDHRIYSFYYSFRAAIWTERDDRRYPSGEVSPDTTIAAEPFVCIAPSKEIANVEFLHHFRHSADTEHKILEVKETVIHSFIFKPVH